MKTPRCIAILSLYTTLLSAEPEKTPMPTGDRVGFPEGYTNTFTILRTVVRDNGAKLVTVYGNAAAASVTNKSQLPYPNGSVLVMESASTSKELGAPGSGAQREVKKDVVLGLHVMRRGQDFGKGYGDKRSGQWEFAEYKPDGSYITPPAKSGVCAECHIKAGAALDFVYQGRLGK